MVRNQVAHCKRASRYEDGGRRKADLSRKTHALPIFEQRLLERT